MMKRFMRACIMLTVAFALGAIATSDNAERASHPMFHSLFITTGAQAQNGGGGGVTCGWCYEFEWGTIEPGWWHHFFDDGGDECGWPVPEVTDPNNLHCSACGGISSCHSHDDPGPCHQDCGGGGGHHVAAVHAAVVEAIRARDTSVVGHVVRNSGAEYIARYVPEGGRLLLFQTCDPVVPVSMIAIPADLRPALSDHLAG